MDVLKKSSYGASSWWMDGFDTSYTDKYLSDSEKHATDLYKMAAHRRAISNFVGIVTSKSIPVTFIARGDSFTNGSSVTISSKIAEPKEFDSAVGLALHEASHIKLSDFKILSDMAGNIDSIIGNAKRVELVKLSTEKRVDFYYNIKGILNWIEDRRIDQYIFNQAPGYRDYYRAMYDKYFNDPLIEKALISNEYTKETLDSYMFRLINLHSNSTRLDALKSLRKIYNVIDLQNISRLGSSKDALGVAIEVVEIILNSIVLPKPPEQKAAEQKEKSPKSSKADKVDAGSNGESDDAADDNEAGSNGESDDEADEADTNGDAGEDVDNDTDDIDGGDGISASGDGDEFDDGSDSNSADNRLTDKQMKSLEKKIKAQEDFINGDIKKSTVSKTEQSQLKNIEDSDAELTVVGKDIKSYSGFKGIECIVIKNMTEALMADENFPLSRRGWDSTTKKYELKAVCAKSVDEGIRLGTVLGKKLQVRSEARETVYNRQVVGRLDKRMVSSLGFGNEHVFFTREIDKYNKANLHISIDASGSMDGEKWTKTMVNVVALAKAVDMIPNLQIQISFRTTQGNTPYIVIAYNSKVDKFIKIKTLFPYLTSGGLTPEGLCFEAVLKYMVSAGTDIDSYFVNISDGEPYFTDNKIGILYQGEVASAHTRKMVDGISKMGIRVLSYYVSNGGVKASSADTFKKCYGKAATFINVTNMAEVSKTMNALFLTK